MSPSRFGVVVLGVFVVACGRVAEHSVPRDGGTDGGANADGGASNTYTSVVRTKSVTKIDLLVVLENSPSMADKQEVLKVAVPDLVQRLVDPPCIDDVTGLPLPAPDPTVLCPPRTHRALVGITSFHVGVITSSLGGSGCRGVDGMSLEQEEVDDHAHLVATRPRFAAALNADPGALAPTPEGFLIFDSVAGTSLTAFNTSVQAMTVSSGEHGCSVEAPLEAAYRFLVDPAPLLTGAASCPGNGAPCAGAGIDTVLLAQRSAFLRPDSLIAVVIVAGGNDHSMGADGAPYPTTRYVNAFSNARVCTSRSDLDASLSCPDLDGDERPDVVDNPLLSDPSGVPRDPSLVYVAGILGVPYQDIRSDTDETGEPYDPSLLHYQTASQLRANDTWEVLLGGAGPHGVAVPPTDALMIESTTPRTGVDGETPPRSLAPPEAGYLANPVNGHEWRNPGNADPQYACIFNLPRSRDCAAVATGSEPQSACDCTAVAAGSASPLCQDASGAYTTTQRFGKAYPSLRELAVLRDLRGPSVASMCSRNLVDPTRQDYGYRPALDPIVARLKTALPGMCLPNAIRPIPDPNDPGKTVAPCTVTEARPNPDGSVHCDPSRGRVDLEPDSVATVLAQLRAKKVCGGDGQAPCATYSLCQLQQSDSSCHIDPYPGPSTPPGWCFVDPNDVPTDDPSLAAHCPPDAQRVLSFVDPRWDTPANDATVLVTCTKSE